MLPSGSSPNSASSRESTASVLLPSNNGLNVHALLSVIPDIVRRIDLEGIFLHLVSDRDPVSANQDDGYVGQRLCDVFPAAVAEQYHAAIEAAMITNEMVEIDYCLPDHGRDVAFKARIVPNDETSVLVVVRDLNRTNHNGDARQHSQLAVSNDRLRAEIAERKRTEEQMRIREERLSLVVSATRVGVWDCDLVSGTVWWNSQYTEMFGTRPDNTAESWEWWVNRVHAEDRDRVVRSYQDTLDSCDNRWHEEYRFLGAEGTYLDILDSAHITRGGSGAAVRILGAMLEVTALKQAEQALQHANQRKDEFLAMLAHELRNPLAPIRTAIDLMSLEPVDNPRVSYARELIGKQANHLVRLVEDLLDVSRITRGTISLQRTIVELADVIDQAVAATAAVCLEREHELLISLPEQAVTLDADPTRLVQIFSNLLGNAIRYTPKGGTIKVQSVVEDSTAMIVVSDNGIGIADGDLREIFDLFVQSKRGIDRSQGGLGIGLTLVRSLVEQHGGSIAVSSEGVGCGSEFIVTLPIAASANTSDDAVIESRVSANTLVTKTRILVVDDLPEAAESMCALLATLGYEVSMALGGQEALDLAPELSPDVMLVDIGMPGLDGYEVARRVRRNPSTADLILIAVSGYCHEDDLQRAHEVGFNCHLPKPATIDEIVAALNEQLAR